MANSSQKINEVLAKNKLFYVTRDIERATAGLNLDLPNFRIITNNSPHAKRLAQQHNNIIIIGEENIILDTRELLQISADKNYIKSGDYVVVFKNTSQIESICQSNDWKLLNPDAKLASSIEEKISQVEWLGPLKKYLPACQIELCKNIKWNGKKFILQYNRSHTGSGTILVTSKVQLEEIAKKFPEREARVVEYIKGPFFTNNNVVWNDKILLGNINYQITGLKPFTDNPFTTIGNDWALPRKILSNEQIEEYNKIAFEVGERLKNFGWKGLFGIDTVLDEKTGKFYLIEINARQPASTTFESELQYTVIPAKAGIRRGLTIDSGSRSGMTTIFEAHLASLLEIKMEEFELVKISDGAQIIQRVTENIPKIFEPKIFKPGNFNYIHYNNSTPNADLLRIQTKTGMMLEHEKLNDIGLQAIDFVICASHGNMWNAPRAGAILIKDEKILLIQRHKYGKDYFTIPGGTLEEGESILDLAKREITEETGLSFEPISDDPIYLDSNGRDEYYYIAKNIEGTAKLGGPESEITFKDNSYALKWVPLKDIKEINLLPETILKYVYDYKNTV